MNDWDSSTSTWMWMKTDVFECLMNQASSVQSRWKHSEELQTRMEYKLKYWCVALVYKVQQVCQKMTLCGIIVCSKEGYIYNIRFVSPSCSIFSPLKIFLHYESFNATVIFTCVIQLQQFEMPGMFYLEPPQTSWSHKSVCPQWSGDRILGEYSLKLKHVSKETEVKCPHRVKTKKQHIMLITVCFAP